MLVGEECETDGAGCQRLLGLNACPILAPAGVGRCGYSPLPH